MTLKDQRIKEARECEQRAKLLRRQEQLFWDEVAERIDEIADKYGFVRPSTDAPDMMADVSELISS